MPLFNMGGTTGPSNLLGYGGTGTSYLSGCSGTSSILNQTALITAQTQTVWFTSSNAAITPTLTSTVGFGGGGGVNQFISMTGNATSSCGGGAGGGGGGRAIAYDDYQALINLGASYSVDEDVWFIDEELYMNNIQYFELARQRAVAFRIRTAEEKRRADEAAEQARIERQRLEAERLAAKERAHELLMSHLTPEQRETVEKNRWFVVIGGKTKTKYRIRTDYGIAGNIEVMSGNKKVATLCCHCKHEIPDSDQFLAQKIALMFDEDNFLRIANRRAA